MHLQRLTNFRGWTVLPAFVLFLVTPPIATASRVAVPHGKTRSLFNHALLQAAREGTVKQAEAALHAGANVNAAEKGVTALMAAASRGGTAMVRLLLARGANVKSSLALGVSDLGMVKQLVRAGADVNCKAVGCGEHGCCGPHKGSPLWNAGATGNIAVIQFLLSHGANLELGVELSTSRTILLSSIARNHDQVTGFHLVALEKDDLPGALVLLLLGADVNARDIVGKTPLLLVVDPYHGGIMPEGFRPYPGRIVYIAELIRRGADINARDSYGRTPLINAARADDIEAASLLIQHGADVNARTTGGKTPLMAAVSQVLGPAAKGQEMVKLLLDAGADAQARD